MIPKPARCRDAVTEWLTHNSGTVIDIAAATGWGTTSIRTAISHLRFFADPCLRNLTNGNCQGILDSSNRGQRAVTVTTVESALANRTPLEQAWR